MMKGERNKKKKNKRHHACMNHLIWPSLETKSSTVEASNLADSLLTHWTTFSASRHAISSSSFAFFNLFACSFTDSVLKSVSISSFDPQFSSLFLLTVVDLLFLGAQPKQHSILFLYHVLVLVLVHTKDLWFLDFKGQRN